MLQAKLAGQALSLVHSIIFGAQILASLGGDEGSQVGSDGQSSPGAHPGEEHTVSPEFSATQPR